MIKNCGEKNIDGFPVIATNDFRSIIKNNHIEAVFLAMPGVSDNSIKSVAKKLSSFGMPVFKTPSFEDLLLGKNQLTLKDVGIDQILSRDSISPDLQLLTDALRNKNIFISGAGGSIGSGLARIAIEHGAANLILFDNSELALYKIDKELQELLITLESKTKLIPLLGNVLDENLLTELFSTNNIDTIFHAAAYKHVPLVESNVCAGALNNICGTYFMASAAANAGVGRFVLISTDKAVRPTNVMGATKRVAELIIQNASFSQSKTIFTSVRFGNVLGSSGSVVPLFKQQIVDNRPVTVTHPDITRFFMTIPEAVSLVVQASSLAQGGEFFYWIWESQ